MLVLSDFDNTITTDDVTNLLWDEFGIPQWRDQLLPPYRAGLVGTLELMDQGWRVVDQSADALLAVAKARIGLRPGLETFVAGCRERQWPLHVISCGLDWYLEAFLPPGVAFTSYTAVREGGWRVRLAAGTTVPPGADFKVHVLRQLQLRYPGVPTAFIGDGRNDFPIARACDRVFALRDSTLAQLCRRDQVTATEFQTFDDVSLALFHDTPAPAAR